MASRATILEPVTSANVGWSRPGRLRRLGRVARQQPLGVFGFVVLVLFLFLGVFGPMIAPFDPRELRTGPPLAGPTWDHPFGTNQLGQDMFSRVIAGARVSLMIASASVFIGAGCGCFLGILGGYFGRWIDTIVQRSGEIATALPFLVIYFMLMAAFGQGVKTIIVAIGIGALFGGNRVLRGITMVQRQAQYIEAARATGCPEWHIFSRHVVPNVMPFVILVMSGALGGAILAESGLAFLGLGVQPGTPSWGIDINKNFSIARLGYWHLVIFPGMAISLVVLGANFLGDALRDVLDPRLRK